MLSKLKNLIIQKPAFIIKVILIFVVVFTSVQLWKKQNAQEIRLKTLQEEKQLAMRIPELKKQVELQTYSRQNKPEKIKKEGNSNLLLKGVFMKDNVYYALIGNKFYQKGDNCGDFIISEINLSYVVIQDLNTNTIQKLYLSK